MCFTSELDLTFGVPCDDEPSLGFDEDELELCLELECDPSLGFEEECDPSFGFEDEDECGFEDECDPSFGLDEMCGFEEEEECLEEPSFGFDEDE